MNRIEEVKKIVLDVWREEISVNKGIDLISQLFPQPLEREKAKFKTAFPPDEELDSQPLTDEADPQAELFGWFLDHGWTPPAELQQKIEQERERIMGKDRPEIICLCGSTRFVDTFNEWRKKLTLEGKIVLSIELVTSQTKEEDPQHNNHDVKRMLDELHLRKIDLADKVMILNVGGYIGNSTRAEIEYAESKGKPIKYLEALKEGNETTTLPGPGMPA